MAQKKQTKTTPKDDLESYGDKRLRVQKIVAWVAISAILVTTAITFGVVPLVSGG